MSIHQYNHHRLRPPPPMTLFAFLIVILSVLLQSDSGYAFTINDIGVILTPRIQTRTKGQQQQQQHGPLYSSSSSFPNPSENESTSFNDAFLNSLENDGNTGVNSNTNMRSTIGSATGGNTGNNGSNSDGGILDNNSIDPPPDSLAALRDMATSNVANFLASFAQPPTDGDGSILNDSNGNALTDQDGSSDVDTEMSMGRNNNNNQSTSSLSSSTTKIPTPLVIPPPKPKMIQWDVYICQSKQCMERGASATLDSFQALVPTTPRSSNNNNNNNNPKMNIKTITTINIHPAILSRSKSKGPNVRCIQRTPPYKSFEVNNVNDIDKVYRILTKHMNITNISKNAKDCLKYTYLGNSQLEKNELSNAIQSYNLALEQGYESQEGILLLLRATAYLKRAFQHQHLLRQTVSDLGLTVADPVTLGKLYSIAEANPSLAKGIFQKVLTDTKAQDKKFRLTKYRHGLYEYSLLHAAQDALRSTQLLPYHAKTWLRAGDALAELRKLKESALYYEKAMELDPTLRGRLEPVIERLNRSQEFLDKAKGWWSSDTLRLALDVAG
jgi:tetratricopeptide (TPR) repeat protein